MNPSPDKNQQPKLALFSCHIRRGFVLTFLLVLALSAGAGLERWVLRTGMPASTSSDFQLMAQAWDIIDRYYVDRPAVRHAAMAAGAINGMTEALGDTGHSVYLSAAEARKAGAAVQGKMNGIGVEILQSSNHTVVVAPVDGSPAQQAGVRAGDVILQVDGHPVSGLPLSHISARMSGEPGQPVALTVFNPSDGVRREIKIVRAAIKINHVSWQQLPGTKLAHLRVAMFSEGETADLRKELLEIKAQGMQGIILDLRNNPGGALDEALGTASQFLLSGNIMWEKNANNIITNVAVEPGGVATDIPLTVLINGLSASDSEIVAGALHDSHRARLVGDTTLGTGTVLSQFQLGDGSALLLAVQEWLTPNKVSFWHRGIEPDVKISLSPNSILLPTLEREMTQAQLQTSGDTQLLKALEVLSQATAKPAAALASP
ncbi:MAG TPA: S41 family peptidase [Verrucomicrobiae bacterium]|jgi:carboxyl-terminal processing protease|nr:S41 family peptidase [Verrucomicrobiae bacterium]